MNIGAGIGIGFAEPRGVLAFEYEQSSGCQNGSDITPVINTPGGTFSSSPAGLSIDSSTGVIDVSASTAGTYTVTYSIGPTEDTITIEAVDDATFSYSASSFPQDGSNPSPNVTGLSGGTFSAGSGLVFVDSGSNTGSSTGQINLSASTIASYTVTYTTAGTCPNTSTQSVEIASALAQVNNVYSMEFDGASDYIDIGLRPTLSATEFTWSFWIYPTSTSGTRAIYSQGSSSATFNNTGYLAVNGSTLALDIYLGGTYSTGPNFVTLDEWQHIVATRTRVNASTYVVRLYRNGVVFNSTGGVFGGGGPASNGYIGSWVWSSGRSLYFEGKIDEGALFDVALTDEQILSIYNATETGKTADLNDLTTPPIKWYRMGD